MSIHFLGVLRRLFRQARGVVPFLFEVIICVLNLRAAYLLIKDQDYFERNAPVYNWLKAYVTTSEWRMAMLPLVAGGATVVGFALLVSRRALTNDVAFILRSLGWGVSFCFWLLMGLSLLLSNFGNIAGGNNIALAVFSLMMMVSGPAMPYERSYASIDHLDEHGHDLLAEESVDG